MKNYKTFYSLFSLQKRVLAVILTIAILFIMLFCRLFYLQIISGKRLQVLASDEWMRELPLASKRGEILDCSGVSLASTITSYNVYVRARNVTDAIEVATELSSYLDLDYEKVLKKVKNTSVSESLIKMQVDEQIALKLGQLNGVYLSQNVKRVYPYSSLLTQVLGYCTIDNEGQAGIENYYNKYLKGIDGKTLTQVTAQGKELNNSLTYYLPSVDGANITTTIDVQMQAILEKELNLAYTDYQAKGVSGIILDVNDGGIKAMACLPNFDLNDLPREDVEQLQNLSKNKSVVDVYEPGSTFKMVTLLASLEENLTTSDERFYCGGKCSVDGETIKCWKSTGHGSINLTEAFKVSCNCVFVQLAERLGVERFYKYLKILGIGEKTGVDIDGESSGILMAKEQVKNVDLARIGFGHAIALTQLKMAQIYASICSNSYVSPHLLKEMSTDGKILYQYNLNRKCLNFSDNTISIINSMLFNNVNSENQMTFVAGYDVGGKTGTAQKYDEDGSIANGKYVSSFIGCYPTSQPKYILIVCVDEPVGAYYGGVVAKPIGQKVFNEIFLAKGIEPSNTDWLAVAPSVDMPYVVGQSIASACAELKKMGLIVLCENEGEYVTAQLPLQNTKLFIGEVVYLNVN